MNTSEILISRLNRIIRDSQDMIVMVKSIKTRSANSSKKYASNAERQKAYRKRKLPVYRTVYQVPDHVGETVRLGKNQHVEPSV